MRRRRGFTPDRSTRAWALIRSRVMELATPKRIGLMDDDEVYKLMELINECFPVHDGTVALVEASIAAMVGLHESIVVELEKRRGIDIVALQAFSHMVWDLERGIAYGKRFLSKKKSAAKKSAATRKANKAKRG